MNKIKLKTNGGYRVSNFCRYSLITVKRKLIGDTIAYSGIIHECQKQFRGYWNIEGEYLPSTNPGYNLDPGAIKNHLNGKLSEAGLKLKQQYKL
jgi:hypothetical protein